MNIKHIFLSAALVTAVCQADEPKLTSKDSTPLSFTIFNHSERPIELTISYLNSDAEAFRTKLATYSVARKSQQTILIPKDEENTVEADARWYDPQEGRMAIVGPWDGYLVGFYLRPKHSAGFIGTKEKLNEESKLAAAAKLTDTKQLQKLQESQN